MGDPYTHYIESQGPMNARQRRIRGVAVGLGLGLRRRPVRINADELGMALRGLCASYTHCYMLGPAIASTARLGRTIWGGIKKAVTATVPHTVSTIMNQGRDFNDSIGNTNQLTKESFCMKYGVEKPPSVWIYRGISAYYYHRASVSTGLKLRNTIYLLLAVSSSPLSTRICMTNLPHLPSTMQLLMEKARLWLTPRIAPVTRQLEQMSAIFMASAFHHPNQNIQFQFERYASTHPKLYAVAQAALQNWRVLAISVVLLSVLIDTAVRVRPMLYPLEVTDASTIIPAAPSGSMGGHGACDVCHDTVEYRQRHGNTVGFMHASSTKSGTESNCKNNDHSQTHQQVEEDYALVSSGDVPSTQYAIGCKRWWRPEGGMGGMGGMGDMGGRYIASGSGRVRVRKGDRLLTVDGSSAQHLSLEEVQRRLANGEAGDSVKLTFLRKPVSFKHRSGQQVHAQHAKQREQQDKQDCGVRIRDTLEAKGSNKGCPAWHCESSQVQIVYEIELKRQYLAECKVSFRALPPSFGEGLGYIAIQEFNDGSLYDICSALDQIRDDLATAAAAATTTATSTAAAPAAVDRNRQRQQDKQQDEDISSVRGSNGFLGLPRWSASRHASNCKDCNALSGVASSSIRLYDRWSSGASGHSLDDTSKGRLKGNMRRRGGRNGDPLKALIVDLRGNPGGPLVPALDIAALFLPRRTVLMQMRVRGRTGSSPDEKELEVLVGEEKGRSHGTVRTTTSYRESEGKRTVTVGSAWQGWGLPSILSRISQVRKIAIRMMSLHMHMLRQRRSIEKHYSLNKAADLDTALLLLVDGRTASASEILVEALCDNARAVSMGTRTVGKNVAQVRSLTGFKVGVIRPW